MYDVIIVGGGAAGLMAAKILSQKGKKTLLLEAKERLGGRIHWAERFSVPAEGGAEFIHGKLKTTLQLLKAGKLNTTKVEGQFCRVENGRWKIDSETFPHWDKLLKKMEDCEEDMTIADFLQTFFHAKKYAILRKQFSRYVEGYDAANIEKTSMFSIRKEMEDEDDVQFRPVPGYAALVDFLKEASLDFNAEIKTNEPVLQISRKKNIEVTTTLSKYICAKIIIAVPLGVLQCRRDSKAFIKFPACLTNHLQAAKKIGNGGVIKFLMEFDEAFWLNNKFRAAKNIGPLCFIFSDTIIPTWWTQYPSQMPLLTGWLAGPPSYEMRRYSQKKLKKLALESLSSIFAMPKKDLENKLKATTVVNWINEPYILGGYSYSTMASGQARAVLLKPVENAFYFAGEYALENSFSTVDSALQSGQEAAEKILDARN